MSERRIVLVGELNPYGADPQYALYPTPRHAAGDRLRRLVMGVRTPTYIGFTRYNLCVGKWSTRDARAQARAILAMHANQEQDDVVVLLGRKVVGAFFGGIDGCPPSDWPEEFSTSFMRYAPLGGRATTREPDNLAVLPHPSGLCRSWNEPGAYERARAVLRLAAPWIQWGEADAASGVSP